MSETFRLPSAPILDGPADTDPAGPILVVLPARALDRAEHDLLRVARDLATVTGESGAREIVALWPYDGADAADPALAGSTTLLRPTAAGEDGAHLQELLTASVPQAVADATVAAAHEIRPSVVLTAAGASATDTAGLVAVRLGSAAIVDAARLTAAPTGLQVTRTVLDGTWTTTAELTRGVGVVTVQFGARVEGAPEAGEPAGAAPDARELPVTASAATAALTLTEHTAPEGGPSLSGAERVVCAGRGVQGDLTLVQELAERFDAAVGGTRVVTDQGWLPRERQVGQSGVSISPRLYLGVAVSGQVHHTMGILGSQYIVAICDDPDAPIFEIADFGVVGDYTTVVPQLLEALGTGA